MPQSRGNERLKPFERCYWVRPQRLLAGCHPGDIDPKKANRSLRALHQAGIRTCIDLTEGSELDFEGRQLLRYDEKWINLSPALNTYLRSPVRDGHVPSEGQIRAILDFIAAEIERGRAVYVHCLGGLGRTGTVVGCWLARHGIASGPAVLEKIQELRKNDPTRRLASPQTEVQRAMVMSWPAGF